MDSVTGLPRWLAHPQIISNNSNEFDSVDPTDSELFDALGIEGLFPFQRTVRERLRERNREGWRDLCVSAPTGSGKTLAYVLPIVESLRERIVSRLAALVVVPTRDLTGQVEDTFRAVSSAYGCQLRAGVDFLVTTPGRLISSLPGLEVEGLKFVVVDEADRLLDQSFQEWLPQLLDKLKSGRSSVGGELFDSEAWQGGGDEPVKKLLFSATLTTNPAKIAPLNLHRPLYLSVRSDLTNEHLGDVLMTPATLSESVAVFGGAEEMKPAMLAELLTEIVPGMLKGLGVPGGVLCFTKSVASAQRLCKLLAQLCPDLQCAAFHGNMSDTDRSRVLESFDSGVLGVLVGSDAMARGLDLKAVGCVVNYDAPVFAATYVHRVGRTARAGQRGLAVTLLPSGQMRHFKQMLRSALNKTVGEDVSKIEVDDKLVSEKWRGKLVESLKNIK